MLCYLYTLDYCDTPYHNGGLPSFLVHAKVWVIAEKYNIHSLKTLANKKFQAKVKHGWEDDGFDLASKEIYISTPEADHNLKDLVCNVTQESVEVLLRQPDFRALLLEVNEFTLEVLDAVVKAYTTERATENTGEFIRLGRILYPPQ